MNEHFIRLRGGWERLTASGAGARVSLPLSDPIDAKEGLVRLVRVFGRPPSDRAAERLELSIRAVPGLVSVELNGSPLTPGPTGRVDVTDLLDARNRLLLTARAGGESWASWGEVSIVVVPRVDEPPGG